MMPRRGGGHGAQRVVIVSDQQCCSMQHVRDAALQFDAVNMEFQLQILSFEYHHQHMQN